MFSDDITTTADGSDTYQIVKDAGRYKWVLAVMVLSISPVNSLGNIVSITAPCSPQVIEYFQP